MRPAKIFAAAIAGALAAAAVFTAHAQSSNRVTTAPVYVPDSSHSGDPLPPNIIAWDSEQKTLDATNGQDLAWFDFVFTNVSSGPVSILGGRGSCSCTTVQLPPVPWLIPTGGAGEFTATINLAGKAGTVLKYAIITTDKGTRNLLLRVNILPPPAPGPMSEEARAKGIAAAKIDRQAVFKGDCASCHAKNLDGKFGQALFQAACVVCHESELRSSMVPDLHHLKDPTSQEFWRAWITSGKPGTLMPAFASSQGGPLRDLQITSLAVYLNAVIPPHPVPAGSQTKN
jgi:mono/diheme cytochrome c family protein